MQARQSMDEWFRGSLGLQPTTLWTKDLVTPMLRLSAASRFLVSGSRVEIFDPFRCSCACGSQFAPEMPSVKIDAQTRQSLRGTVSEGQYQHITPIFKLHSS